MSDHPHPPTSVPPRTSLSAPLQTGLAVTALVLGLLALVSCPLIGIVAIILGIVALNRTSREPQRYGGRGMAIGGIACGGGSFLTGLMIWGMLSAIMLPSLSRARELSKRLVCAANIKGIGTSMKIYDLNYPDAAGPIRIDALVKDGLVTPAQLICPSDEFGTTNYVLVPLTDDPPPPRTVMLYEPKSNHGDEGGNILFADGHVEFVKSPGYDRLIAGIAPAPPPDPAP